MGIPWLGLRLPHPAFGLDRLRSTVPRAGGLIPVRLAILSQIVLRLPTCGLSNGALPLRRHGCIGIRHFEFPSGRLLIVRDVRFLISIPDEQSRENDDNHGTGAQIELHRCIQTLASPRTPPPGPLAVPVTLRPAQVGHSSNSLVRIGLKIWTAVRDR